MGLFKKVVKNTTGALGSVAGMVGLGQKAQMPTIKTPAQQLERQAEVGTEDITLGTDDDTSVAKGKRALLRPTANTSLGGI